jgi:hypothetical protein
MIITKVNINGKPLLTYNTIGVHIYPTQKYSVTQRITIIGLTSPSALHCKPTSYVTCDFPNNAQECGKMTIYTRSSQVRTENF